MFSKGKNGEERFKITYKQGALNSFKILVDVETGVNYIFYQEGYAGGLTVLLDEEGNPVITAIDE